MSLGALRDRLALRRDELRNRSIFVLAGGSSHEREVSLTSGNAVASAMREYGYQAALVAVNPDDLTFDPAISTAFTPEGLARLETSMQSEAGIHSTGKSNSLVSLVRQAGIVFTTLHGTRGEDGVWQGLLEMMDVPYVSAGVKGSAISMDKLVSKRLFEQLQVPTPRYWVLRRGEDLKAQIPTDVTELVAKPVDQGSSVGIAIVKNDDAGWAEINKLNGQFNPLLIEQRIHARELTAGVIGTVDAPIPLPLVEIKPTREFYDYTAKYTKGASAYECPARIDPEIVARVQQQALTIYREFDVAPYARIDFLLHESGTAYCLEVNTLPGFTELSLLPQAAKAHGITFGELLELLMLCALERWEQRHGGGI